MIIIKGTNGSTSVPSRTGFFS